MRSFPKRSKHHYYTTVVSSGMAFSVCGVINKPTTRITSNVNDFVKVKTRAEKKLLSAEYKLAVFEHLIHLNFALKEYIN